MIKRKQAGRKEVIKEFHNEEETKEDETQKEVGANK